jgi:hypothetical protein
MPIGYSNARASRRRRGFAALPIDGLQLSQRRLQEPPTM